MYTRLCVFMIHYFEKYLLFIYLVYIYERQSVFPPI